MPRLEREQVDASRWRLYSQSSWKLRANGTVPVELCVGIGGLISFSLFSNNIERVGDYICHNCEGDLLPWTKVTFLSSFESVGR